MKKIVSLLLVTCLFVSCFCNNVSANDQVSALRQKLSDLTDFVEYTELDDAKEVLTLYNALNEDQLAELTLIEREKIAATQRRVNILEVALVAGDIDLDEIVNTSDALLTLQNSVNLITFDQAQTARADVDANGTITASDALEILSFAVKKIDCFAAIETLVEGVMPEFDTEIMTFNIRCPADSGIISWDSRRLYVTKYINSSTADIIGMQEVTVVQKDFIAKRLDDNLGYVYYAREEGANPEGLMTVYDKTVYTLVDASMFWLSETPDKMSYGWGASYYRICVLTTLQHNATGKKINVYNIHLDHQVEAARVNGLNLIMSRMAQSPYPTVVLGDFNANKTTSCYGTISEKMVDCQSAAVSDNGCTYNGWNASAITGNPIDFIFVDGEYAEPLTYAICRDQWYSEIEEVYSLYSDHYAVKSKINFLFPLE